MMRVRAFAKLNLSLRVVGLREDGFHEIESIVQTIDLADELVISSAEEGLIVENDLEGLRGKDLAEVAAARVLDAKGAGGGARIRVAKHIPSGAGLGGGSSDAAAVLRTLDRLMAPRLPESQLHQLGASIGSDVPLFLVGGRLRVTGRGECVETIEVPGDEVYVLLVPPIHCDTAEIYRRWDALPPADQGTKGLGHNDLLAPALDVHPGLSRYHAAVRAVGGRYAGMSGSGSSFFAVFVGRAEAADAEARLREMFPEAFVCVCSPTSRGQEVIEGGGCVKIAIDGPAGSGKTSLGRALAEEFGCRFVSTGQMYRAVGMALRRGLALEEIELEVTEDERLIMNGEDVSDQLHTPEIDQASSEVATIPEVRARLVAQQQRIAEGIDIVMEGRDIGTVVLPDADVKIFLAARPGERARRRALDRGEEKIDQTLREIISRDHRDTSREVGPLNAATDATIIDTDRKPLAEVISEAIHLVKERLGRRCSGG